MKSQVHRIEISLTLILILALSGLLSGPFAAAAPAANSRAVPMSDAAPGVRTRILRVSL